MHMSYNAWLRKRAAEKEIFSSSVVEKYLESSTEGTLSQSSTATENSRDKC